MDLLFPPLCINCRVPVSEVGALCSHCWTRLQFLDGAACAVCGLPFDVDPGQKTLCGPCTARLPHFDMARAILNYDDASRGLILALKYADRLDLAPPFARWLNRTGRELVSEADILVPVPLHPFRLWRRRYNQAAELARWLGQHANKPVESLLLLRRRSTPSQGAMPSARARRRNVAGAFAVPPRRRSEIRGRTILLIDDVLTTGATANACARTLKRAGAAKVCVLALARVVRPQNVTI